MQRSFLRKYRNIFLTFWIVGGLIMLLDFFLKTMYWVELPSDFTEGYYPQAAGEDLSCQSNPLCLIPQQKVDVWDERDFLVVFGLPSLDIPFRRWRRHMQRVTCWQFPQVAARENNFTGAFLPLYLLARHPHNNNILSREVVDEAEQWHDIVIHPMSDEKSTTNKINDGKGKWGVAAEIGSGRKTFFWFQFALRQFPQVPFIAKGDDDMFLRVPQYLADLRRLPRRGTYWGRRSSMKSKIVEHGPVTTFYFVWGFCATLARDTAEHFVSYEPLKRLSLLPYSSKLHREFMFVHMNYEDIMIGHALKATGFRYIIFAEKGERFSTDRQVPVSNNIVVTHVPPEDEYYFLMKRFLVNSTTSRPTIITKKTSDLFSVEPPADGL